LFLLTTYLILVGVRMAQPAPMCLIYTKSAGEGYLVMEADSRTGQIQPRHEDFPTIFDIAPHSTKRDRSPNHQAFAMYSESNYAGPDNLFVGVLNSEKLSLVE